MAQRSVEKKDPAKAPRREGDGKIKSQNAKGKKQKGTTEGTADTEKGFRHGFTLDFTGQIPMGRKRCGEGPRHREKKASSREEKEEVDGEVIVDS